MIESILKSNRVESTLSYMATMPLLTNISFLIDEPSLKSSQNEKYHMWFFNAENAEKAQRTTEKVQSLQSLFIF